MRSFRIHPIPRAILFAAIIVLGIFFRFYQIDQKLVWHDEIYTQLFAAGTQAREWRSTIYTGRVIEVAEVQALTRNREGRSVLDTVRGLAADEPQHPPVYYILARIFVSVFGDSIGVLRRLSALGGLAALPAMYWFALEAFRSRRVALSATALIAVSPFFVLYAQEARQYSLWAALILASNAALLRAIRLTASASTETLAGQKPGCTRAWLYYAAFTVLSLYTSFSTAAVIGAQAIFIALRERLRVTPVSLRAAAALAASGLVFAPWAWLLVRNMDSFAVSMAWSRIITIPRTELLATLALNTGRVFWNGAPNIAALDIRIIAGLVPTLLLSAAALTAVGRRIRLPRAARHPANARTSTGLLLLALFCIPIAMLLIPDLLFGGIRSISGRYLTPAWIALIAALAWFTRDRPNVGEFNSQNAIGAVSRAGRSAALVATLSAGLLTCYFNSQRFVVWTKGISMRLPEVAAIVNAADSPPLITGDFERHHPGNLLALSQLLEPGTRMQLLPRHDPDYRLPSNFKHVFLYSPIPQFRQNLKDESGRPLRVEKLIDGLYLDLWRVDRGRNGSGGRNSPTASVRL